MDITTKIKKLTSEDIKTLAAMKKSDRFIYINSNDKYNKNVFIDINIFNKIFNIDEIKELKDTISILTNTDTWEHIKFIHNGNIYYVDFYNIKYIISKNDKKQYTIYQPYEIRLMKKHTITKEVEIININPCYEYVTYNSIDINI